MSFVLQAQGMKNQGLKNEVAKGQPLPYIDQRHGWNFCNFDCKVMKNKASIGTAAIWILKKTIIFLEIRELKPRGGGAKLVIWGKMPNNGAFHIFIQNSTSKFRNQQYNYSRVLHIRNHFLTLRWVSRECSSFLFEALFSV